MNTLTISRKNELIERARVYHHPNPRCNPDGSYELIIEKDWSKEPGEAVWSYQEQWEPIVEADGLFDLDGDNAWLTVNQYNALVLNTRNMLIADIDCGDPRLNRFAGAKDCGELCKNLGELHLLDKDMNPFLNGLIDPDLCDEKELFDDFNFADQSYRVYRTHSGWRVICTSIALPWKWTAHRLLHFMRSDPNYIRLCDIQKCYRARLTPKPWRDKGEPTCVCVIVHTEGEEKVAPELEEQLRLHDEMTLSENDWSELA